MAPVSEWPQGGTRICIPTQWLRKTTLKPQPREASSELLAQAQLSQLPAKTKT